MLHCLPAPSPPAREPRPPGFPSAGARTGPSPGSPPPAQELVPPLVPLHRRQDRSFPCLLTAAAISTPYTTSPPLPERPAHPLPRSRWRNQQRGLGPPGSLGTSDAGVDTPLWRVGRVASLSVDSPLHLAHHWMPHSF
nr:anther-specific proline-rich protein APG-like [Lolium perenne]